MPRPYNACVILNIWRAAGLRQRLRQLVLVGCVTPTTMLVQEATELMLLDISYLANDLFRQLVGCSSLVFCPCSHRVLQQTSS